MEDIEISFKVEDLSPQVKEELDKAVKRALYAAGITIQRGATEAITELVYNKNEEQQKEEKKKAKEKRLYRRTGRLRASISFITPDQRSPQISTKPPNAMSSDNLSGVAPANTLIFGTNVEYASYVHEGTRRMAARPFLRKGVDAVRGDIKDTIDRIFRGEL